MTIENGNTLSSPCEPDHSGQAKKINHLLHDWFLHNYNAENLTLKLGKPSFYKKIS